MGQSEQEDAPSFGLLVPAPQSEHVEIDVAAVADENFPAAQSAHVVDDMAPVEDENFPAVQSAHW